jgi:transposase-like protein
MSRRPRRNHSAAFKAKVAIEALADGKTIAEIAQKHDVHPNQVTEWRRQLMERAAGVFGGRWRPRHRRWISRTARQDRAADAGERFFRRRAHQGGIAERKAMIDREA